MERQTGNEMGTGGLGFIVYRDVFLLLLVGSGGTVPYSSPYRYSPAQLLRTRCAVQGLGFRDWGFRVLGFRASGFRV